MQVILAVCRSLADRFDLADRWELSKDWLTREDRRIHRRVTLAAGIFFLALLIALVTTCSGGPQIYP
ncbi:MAG: hypothetical protein AAF797_08445 [Planctomycetota bacterium]